jgi:putative SOS response-associated peptidase YedK
MCGRFTLARSPEDVARAFGLDKVPNFPPRYNIAPSQPVGVFVCGKNASKPEFRLMGWGLIPSWAKDPAIGAKLINARSETVAEKPSFRAAFKYRRCLIPADGFYEWQKTQQGTKQPFYFSMAGNAVFAFAGLWESWNDIETCTILTTSANGLVQPIHDRMPVILSPENYGRWLDPNIQGGQLLSDLLRPFSDAFMHATPVSTRVNSAKIDDALCIEILSSD